ncbi:MAG TPA: peptidoglycan-binding protein [Xanthobacteraceae bacterium]|nr:peptidoglycan-binding protein [Xanthobacteraceae bacterium]
MFTPASITLIAGLALIVVGLVGGGIQIKEITIPQLPMVPRAACFLIGCILTALVIYLNPKLFLPSQPDKRDDLGTAITNHLIDVHDVKRVLKQLGIYLGPINNEPEPAYFQAVANFQQSRNIGQNGLVDGETYGKLREAWPEFFGQQQSTPAQTAGSPSPPTQTTGPPSPPTQTTGPSSPPTQTAGPPASTNTASSETKTEVTPLCKIQPNHKARPSPGVNCTATGTLDEVEICGNTDLCDLDWQLYSFYQVAKTGLDKNQLSQLAKAESAWVKKRGECASDARCIAKAYKLRIDQLR